MKIKILAFGIAREICGAGAFELDVPANCDSDSLRQLLAAQFPALDLLAACNLAVNAEYVVENISLAQGDEIAILPPVSGG